MQTKGLVLPWQPYKSALHVKRYYPKPLRSGGSLTNHYHWHRNCHGLSNFKIFTSNPEQSDPLPEPSSSQSTEPNKEVVSLSSWADDVSQSPSATDDWGPPPARPSQPPGRHPIANALFVLSLGGIAVGAFFLGRKFNAYNQAMTTEAPIAEVGYTSDGQHEKKDTVPATTTAITTNGGAIPRKINITPTLPNHKETETNTTLNIDSKEGNNELEKEGSTFDEIVETLQEKTPSVHPSKMVDEEEEEELQSPPSSSLSPAGVEKTTQKSNFEAKDVHHALPSSSKPPSETAVAKEEEEEEEGRKDNREVSMSSLTNDAHAVEEKKDNKVVEETNNILPDSSSLSIPSNIVDEEEPLPKLPLRTAEAEAALERIRAIQQRRQELYDKAIARQENKLKTTSPLSPQLKSEIKVGTLLPSGSLYANEDEVERNPQGVDILNNNNGNGEDLVENIDIPKGMSLRELRERAVAANKAAAASATAAHKAAAASAMAADAADTATHAAQQASLAAAQCQSALDLRSADAIEEAYRAAAEAEEQAETALRRAAVSSAKAVVNKRDAEKKATVASKAAELSSPHGIVAQTDALWRQVRRETAAAVEKTKENGQAGVAAAGWMWNQGSEKVQNALKGVQKSLSGAGTGTEQVEIKMVTESSGEKKDEPPSENNSKGKGWFFSRSKVKK